MAISINLCSFGTIRTAVGFDELVDEYIAETANPVIGEAGCADDRYFDLELSGKLRCIGVFEGNLVVGAAILLVEHSQHYPFPIIGLDAVFIRKQWRRGRNGLDLLGAIKALVKREGAPGFPVMAPVGGKLDRLSKALGLVQTHNTYWCPCHE